MTHRTSLSVFILAAFAAALVLPAAAALAQQQDVSSDFRTSQTCLTCHNDVKSSQGQTFSIAAEWSASIMANSARDPYWQGSVRRETVDHPAASAAIQDECASCHMPLQTLRDRAQHRSTPVFSLLPLSASDPHAAAAADGVTCTVCHQMQPAGLGTLATDNGRFTVAPLSTHPRPVFGPFPISSPAVLQMHQMVAGYEPIQSAQITQAEECASCHTLYTTALSPGGKPVGHLPEQMTFDEWLHSGYHNRETCQQCHMPEVHGQVAIAAIMSPPLSGVRRHTFIGSNFFMEDILDANRTALNVTAPSAAMTAEAKAIVTFLQTKAARVSLNAPQLSAGRLSFAVQVVNLSGHKLPTGFPSRRAWLHVVVTDAHGRTVFESGRLNPDGSIVGNANDASPTRYSPSYSLITQPTQVEIFEPILGDDHNHVTTGLVSATHYLKDNRILPAGFDKQIAPPNIAVYGKAASDPDFIGGSATTRYAVSTHGAAGPFHVTASLVYQPIGYRWAHNLAAYKGEPQRFVHEYEQAAAHSSLVLAHAQTTVSAAH